MSGEKRGVREDIEKQARDERVWREERRKVLGVDPLTGKKDVPSQDAIRDQVAKDWNKHGDG